MSNRNQPLFGALALELSPGSEATTLSLPQRDAGELAAAIARDLAGFQPLAATLRLAVLGAHFDPVELLRSGWPLHRELEQLAAQAPGSATVDARVVSFGSHDGRMPGAVSPSTDHAGGPLRLVPWVLTGEPDVLGPVREAFETDLMETGMADAATALMAQEAFGLRVEHARHLTIMDLCAQTALQYEHAGLAPVWPLLETALLSPAREAWLDAPPEPLLHYGDGEVRMALFSADAWRNRYAGQSEDDEIRLQRRFAQFEARQRQLAALLGAHGVQVTFAHCSGDPIHEL